MRELTQENIDWMFKANSIIYDFVAHENNPCQLDHHGNCQEHGWFSDNENDTCHVRRGRDLLELDK